MRVLPATTNKTTGNSNQQVLEPFCARPGWTFEVTAAVGSGVNDHPQSWTQLPDAIIGGAVRRLAITLQNLWEMITGCSAWLYGSRSRKRPKRLDGLRKAVEQSPA